MTAEDVKLISAAARDIDRALGKGSARRTPILVGLERLSRVLVARGKAPPARPRAPFVLERRKRDEHTHERLLDAWSACFEDEPKTSREACELASRSDLTGHARALRAVLTEIAGERRGAVSARRLGKWLQCYSLVRIGGRQIRAVRYRDHSVLWAVEDQKGGRRPG